MLLFSERLYTDKHEWVSVDGQTGTIGISHYAQVSFLVGFVIDNLY